MVGHRPLAEQGKQVVAGVAIPVNPIEQAGGALCASASQRISGGAKKRASTKAGVKHRA
jgi:hypothetical protein